MATTAAAVYPAWGRKSSMNVSALSMCAPPRALDDAIDVGLLEAERRSAHGLILRTPAGEELGPALAFEAGDESHRGLRSMTCDSTKLDCQYNSVAKHRAAEF